MARSSLREDLSEPYVRAPTLLDVHDLAELLHCSPNTIYRAARMGDFPRPVTNLAGGKSQRWLTSEYVEWVERQRAMHGGRIRTIGRKERR